jgi:2-dehydro-3-deoxygluconokinase
VKRVVTVGELLLRLSPPGEERLLASPQLETCFGGAEANVAVALSHLGVHCDYVTRLPANPLGDAGLAALAREGVGTDWITRGGERLGLYFVESGTDLRAMRVVYDRAGSAFAGIDPSALDWPRVLAGADWVHATGITPALGEGPAQVVATTIAHAHAAGIPVSFDLNYREALWRGRDPRPLITPLVQQADVLIGNAGAASAMLDVEADDGQLPARLATRFGARLVAVTRRELLGPREQRWSAMLYDAATGRQHASRPHQVCVVDRVGGGDSFAAGLIAKLLAGAAPDQALEFAAAAGALKLTLAGDFSRASVGDVEAWLSR